MISKEHRRNPFIPRGRRRVARLEVALLLSLLVAGCGTILVATSAGPPKEFRNRSPEMDDEDLQSRLVRQRVTIPWTYSGTRLDLYAISGKLGYDLYPQALLLIVDLPLSLLTDTLLLPWTIPAQEDSYGVGYRPEPLPAEQLPPRTPVAEINRETP